jgi:hypothetical protein
MLTSIQKPSRAALPMLTAVLLSFFSNPSSAQGPAASSPHLVPGRAMERITPQATVVSTANYQVALALTCTGNTHCEGDLPPVGGRRQLNLTRMSCYMLTSTYSNYALGQIDLRSGNTSLSLAQVLPADYSTQWGYHSLNRAIDVRIAARQSIRVLLDLASGGQAYAAVCTAHGTLDTLQ